MTLARFLRIARQRFTAIVRRGAVERDIDRELAWHLEQSILEKIADGASEEDARREAHREFGVLALVTERSRDARGVTTINGFVDDVRYALRLLRRTPAFTAIAGLALAAGIGTTAAAAAVVSFVLARPLPFPDGDRLITIRTDAVEPALFARAASVHQYRAWQARSASLAAVGASRGGSHVIAAEPGAPPLRVQGQAFTPSLFALLGVRPEAGRLFEEDDHPFGPRALVVVISHRLWQRRYGGAPGTIGRRIRVDSVAREIVGILPADFHLQADNIDVWIPLILAPAGEHGPAQDTPQLRVTARLRPGATLAAARADLEAIAADLHPERAAPRLDISPLRRTLYGWTRPRLATLGAMSTLLLALSCANVAALLLARGTLRRRELAMRAALGASRRRIVRQLLTESLVLGLAAAVPAVLVTAFGLPAVSAALGPPPGLFRLTVVPFDVAVLATVAALCVLSSIAFGVVPAIAGSRVHPIDALHGGTARSASGRSWRGGLVALQIALADVLLVAGALLTASYVNVSGRELNFEPRGLLTFSYAVRADEFIRPMPQRQGSSVFEVSPDAARTFETLSDRLKQLPGSRGVAGISFPPVNSLVLPMVTVQPLDATRDSLGAPTAAAYFIVTPEVFATLQTPILHGREFDARDGRDAPWTIVVNEAMARLCWPGGNPVGRRVRLDLGDGERPREIIGVVATMPARLDEPAAQPAVYTSYLQQPRYYRGPAVGMFAGMTFLMRPKGDADVLLAAARRAAAEVSPERPIDEVGAVQSHLYARLAERRNYVTAVDTFALLAALLAIVGLHGVATHVVVGRANEFAVRRALGARRREILALVALPSLWLVAAGLVMGAAIALPAARLLAPQLWGVAPTDIPTYVGASATLLGAAAIGCAAPMRRALRCDPTARLRAE